MKPALESFTPLTAGLKTVRGRKSFFPRPVLGFRLKNLTKGKGKKNIHTFVSRSYYVALVIKIVRSRHEPSVSFDSSFPPERENGNRIAREGERKKKRTRVFT